MKKHSFCASLCSTIQQQRLVSSLCMCVFLLNKCPTRPLLRSDLFHRHRYDGQATSAGEPAPHPHLSDPMMGAPFARPCINCLHFSMCACYPCAEAMLIFSVSFQFIRMIPEGNPDGSPFSGSVRLAGSQHIPWDACQSGVQCGVFEDVVFDNNSSVTP